MNRRPVRWRARWALAQITGVIVSSVFWIVLVASAFDAAVAALLVGAGFVAAYGTRPVLRLAFGARPANVADRDAVLRAIVPVASLRGRNQPRVFVGKGRRAVGWDVLVPRRRILLVSESMLAAITAGRISGLEVSALVAHASGQLPVLGSRAILAVEVYGLPWAVAKAIVEKVSKRLSGVPLMSLSWKLRPVVLGLGLLDAVQAGRWEAAVPLVVLAVLTYTTGPLDRAWRRRLTELGDRRVSDEGLGAVFADMVLDPHDPADRRRSTVLLGVGHG